MADKVKVDEIKDDTIEKAGEVGTPEPEVMDPEDAKPNEATLASKPEVIKPPKKEVVVQAPKSEIKEEKAKEKVVHPLRGKMLGFKSADVPLKRIAEMYDVTVADVKKIIA